jgi:hypothetical protein
MFFSGEKGGGVKAVCWFMLFLTFRSTIYLRIRAPPSEAGGSHLRSTKLLSQSTSSTFSGGPGTSGKIGTYILSCPDPAGQLFSRFFFFFTNFIHPQQSHYPNYLSFLGTSLANSSLQKNCSNVCRLFFF